MTRYEKDPNYRSSPRMWRCFSLRPSTSGSGRVFSTHVEVFPRTLSEAIAARGLLHACGGVSASIRSLTERLRSLLHACGGVSDTATKVRERLESSPRMWRCFLADRQNMLDQLGLLHACGGVSDTGWVVVLPRGSSPRMWRCF